MSTSAGSSVGLETVGCGGGSGECQSKMHKCGRIQSNVPLWMPPPSPVILFNLAEPPARIFASRRSLRIRAWSAALEGGVLGSEEGTGGGVSAILAVFLRPVGGGSTTNVLGLREDT